MNPLRSITEGAILTALYSIFLLALLFLPLVGTFFMFILPLPFIIYVVRHSFKKGFLLLTVALIITYIIGSIAALPLTFMFGTTGMIMGYFYSTQKNPFAVLISGSLSFILNFVLMYIISIIFFQINFIEDTKKMMYQSIQSAEKMVSAIGQPTDQFKMMYDYIDMISYIVPSAIVIISIVLAFITQFFGNQLLKRFKQDIKSFPPLRQWQFPKSVLWYYLIVTIIMMIGVEQGTMLFTIVVNLFIVLEITMTIQGLSFVFYYFYEKNKGIAIPVTILIISLLIPFLLYIIRILGIIDLGFNLRKRMNNPQ